MDAPTAALLAAGITGFVSVVAVATTYQMSLRTMWARTAGKLRGKLSFISTCTSFRATTAMYRIHGAACGKLKTRSFVTSDSHFG